MNKVRQYIILAIFTAIQVAWVNQYAKAQDSISSFYCGKETDGTPTVMVRHPQRGETPVIRFIDDPYFSERGWTPELRCEVVSQRFQLYKNNGELQYLTTGWVNGLPVICVTSDLENEYEGSCSGILLTLNPSQDPNIIRQDLLALRSNTPSHVVTIGILSPLRSSQQKKVIRPEPFNELCHLVLLTERPKKIPFSCEQAVTISDGMPRYRSSRGIARALTGDIPGAIADFQSFIDSPDTPDDLKPKREAWIRTLQSGENPFTPEVLEELRNE